MQHRSWTRGVRGVLHGAVDPCSGLVDLWYDGAQVDASTLNDVVRHAGPSELALVAEGTRPLGAAPGEFVG